MAGTGHADVEVTLAAARRAVRSCPRDASDLREVEAILARVAERYRQRQGAILTPEEVGHALDVSANRVRAWCRAGLFGERSGGRWIVRAEEVAAVLAIRQERGIGTFAAVLRLRQPG